MPRRRGGSKRTANAMEEADGEAPPQITGAETEKAAADANTSSADGLVSNRPQEAPSNEPLEVTTTKQSNGAIADSDSSDQVSEDSDTGLNGGDVGADTWRVHSEDEEVKEEEEEEEEILVVLELADFKNHPILDDYKSITIEGIDTPKPTLHIGEYALHGQLEETVGTHYFYDTKNRTDVNEYRYTGQTTKKIKFTIAPPEEY